jgi:hypothetical protein
LNTLWQQWNEDFVFSYYSSDVLNCDWSFTLHCSTVSSLHILATSLQSRLIKYIFFWSMEELYSVCSVKCGQMHAKYFCLSQFRMKSSKFGIKELKYTRQQHSRCATTVILCIHFPICFSLIFCCPCSATFDISWDDPCMVVIYANKIHGSLSIMNI